VKRLVAAMIALAAALSAATPAAGEELLVASGDRAVWLVRVGGQGITYDVVARPLDGEWKWVSRQTSGQPAAAAATDNRLHLFFRPLAYVTHELRPGQPYEAALDRADPGRNPDDPRWAVDAAPLALVSAAGWPAGGGATSALVAIVPHPAGLALPGTSPEAQPSTFTAPANPADAETRPATRVLTRGDSARLGVFLKLGNEWTHVADAPGRFRFSSRSRLLTIIAGDALYVLAADAPHGRVLLAYRGGQWDELSTDAWPDAAETLAMLTIEEAPTAVIASPAAGDGSRIRLHLAAWDESGGTFALQPVTREGKPASWAAETLPQAARLGSSVMLVWREGGQLLSSLCGNTGEMRAAQTVDIFASEPPDGHGAAVIQVFTMALLVALFLPLFIGRPPTPVKPFTLPQTMRPGSPVKRLLAGIIDLFPCAALAGVVFQVEPQSMEQVQDLAAQGVVPANMAYAFVTMLLLYTAYAMAMEWRFRATLGMMIFRLKVVGDEGSRPDIRSLYLRNAFRILELLFTWQAIPWLLVLVLVTRCRQRLGDIFARTTVIDASYVAPHPPQDVGPLPPEQREPPPEQRESPHEDAEGQREKPPE